MVRLPAQAVPDLSATLTAQEDAVVLFAVNDGLEAISRPLDFSAFGSKGQELEVWTLADRKQAGEPDVTNSFGEPERITARQSIVTVASSALRLQVPTTLIERAQVAGLEWKLRATSIRRHGFSPGTRRPRCPGQHDLLDRDVGFLGSKLDRHVASEHRAGASPRLSQPPPGTRVPGS